MATLRSAAEYLGLGAGGSTKTLWHKLNQLEHQQLFASANRLYREQNKHKGLIQVSIPRRPTDSTGARNAWFTYGIPYQLWCDACLTQEPCWCPTPQLEYGSGRSEGKTSSQTVLTVVLFGVDCESRMLMAMPLSRVREQIFEDKLSR